MQRYWHMGKNSDNRYGREEVKRKGKMNKIKDKKRGKSTKDERGRMENREHAGSQTVDEAIIILDEIKSEIILLAHQQRGCLCVWALLVKDWTVLINLIVFKKYIKNTTCTIAQNFCDTLLWKKSMKDSEYERLWEFDKCIVKESIGITFHTIFSFKCHQDCIFSLASCFGNYTLFERAAVLVTSSPE